jgi:hypothetical protein
LRLESADTGWPGSLAVSVVTTTTLGAASSAACTGATTVTGRTPSRNRVAHIGGAERRHLVAGIDGDDGAGLGLRRARRQGDRERQAGESSERARRHAGLVSSEHGARPRIVYCPHSRIARGPAWNSIDARSSSCRRPPALTGSAPASSAGASGGAATQVASGMVAGARALGIHRVGQLNMTEHDPVALDVEAWADYWASLKVDVVLVSVTPASSRSTQTQVPFHRKGKYLGTRDFFGDCFAAAKKRGLKVIARMSPDLNWEDATRAHPEWFRRDAQDRIVVHEEDARLFRTCMFSTYMTDYVPAVMKEVLGLYDVDGVYTNAWPPLAAIPRCACAVCRTLPPHGTLEHWEAFNRRTIELWRLYDGLAQDEEAVAVLLRQPGRRRALDRRSGVARRARPPGSSATTRAARRRRRADLGLRDAGPRLPRVQPDKMATNVTGAWSTRRAALAQRPQGAARRAHVAERDGGVGHGAVPPHHRRRDRPRRGPPRARTGAPVLRLARAGISGTSPTAAPSRRLPWSWASAASCSMRRRPDRPCRST